jgi:hypothetical protein
MPPKNESNPSKTSRRQFARKIVVAGTGAALASFPASAAAPAIDPPEEAGVESRYQRILQQYGDRLSEEQKARLRKILAYNQKMMEPIRNFPLENGQPTASVLKFYPDSNSRLS